MDAIHVRDLSIAYSNRTIIGGFSLHLAQGEAALLAGPSGCGKSTLLHAICGLIPADIPARMGGDIRLFGDDVRSLRREQRVTIVGMVFQNPETQLFCDTVAQEIAFGLENICMPRDEMARKVDEVLGFCGLTVLRDASPKQLSGGQKQLVSLAAVLALSPKILLLDEVFSELDRDAKALLSAQLAECRRRGQTILAVDHDRTDAPFYDRIIEMNA